MVRRTTPDPDQCGQNTALYTKIHCTPTVHVQVADETGEVQYATQTVTVTERDAKALGQPVGSTTTVLLTAYPGGHSGAAAGGAGEGASTAAVQPAASDSNNILPTTQQGSSSTNVQVVYSASHVDNVSDSIGTNTTSTVPIQTGTETLSAGLVSSSSVATGATCSEVTSVTSAINTVLSAVATTTPDSTIGDVVGSEYLNPSATQEMIMGGAESGGNNEGGAPTDLATQLINEYTSGGDGTAFGEVKSAQDQPASNQPSVVPAATPPIPTSTEN